MDFYFLLVLLLKDFVLVRLITIPGFIGILNFWIDFLDAALRSVDFVVILLMDPVFLGFIRNLFYFIRFIYFIWFLAFCCEFFYFILIILFQHFLFFVFLLVLLLCTLGRFGAFGIIFIFGLVLMNFLSNLMMASWNRDSIAGFKDFGQYGLGTEFLVVFYRFFGRLLVSCTLKDFACNLPLLLVSSALMIVSLTFILSLTTVQPAFCSFGFNFVMAFSSEPVYTMMPIVFHLNLSIDMSLEARISSLSFIFGFIVIVNPVGMIMIIFDGARKESYLGIVLILLVPEVVSLGLMD